MSEYSFHVDDIYAIRDKKMEREYRTYNKMLERVYKRIMMVEKKGTSDMMYEVEPFVPGMPLYSKEYAINYILHHMKASGFQCTYMGESYIYINWGNRRKSARPNQNEIQNEKRRKRYEIKRIVHAPEYRQMRPESHNTTLPSNIQNSSVNIQNPAEFMNIIQRDKPDFSIHNLKRIRHTAKQIQQYK